LWSEKLHTLPLRQQHGGATHTPEGISDVPKGVEEPDDDEEGEEDPGESESESADEDLGTITAFKYKRGLPGWSEMY
jgi:hypothetical protein